MENSVSSVYSAENTCYLLKKQSECIPQDYLSSTQGQMMTEAHRKIITEWAFDHLSRFPSRFAQLSIHFLDTALSRIPLNSIHELELMGIASVGLVMKLAKGRTVLTSEFEKSENTIFSTRDILSVENLIIEALNWNLDRVCASELLDSLVSQSNLKINTSEFVLEAEKYMKVCYCDYELSLHGPLLIALASASCTLDDLNCTLDDLNSPLKVAWLEAVGKNCSISTSEISQLSSKIRKNHQAIRAQNIQTHQGKDKKYA